MARNHAGMTMMINHGINQDGITGIAFQDVYQIANHLDHLQANQQLEKMLKI